MSENKRPFHEVEYRKENSGSCPILDILVRKSKKKISAYADTGCTTGISLFKEQIVGTDLGIKINDEPSPCIMADGHIIGADEYLTVTSINGEEREIVISVIDPSIILGFVSPQRMEPLLGRDFLDTFDVLFKGKEKKIALFKC